MKPATLACLAALCLIGPPAHAAPIEPAAARAAPPAAQSTGAEPAAAPRPASAARAERRRRSYAACNRASHQRNLYGGRRRRFLIRCRLGYERTRGSGAQQPAASPAQPGRKP